MERQGRQGVRVRTARASDLPAVAALLEELGYAREIGALKRDFARALEDRRSRILAASYDGQVVGLAALYYVPVLHESGRWCRLTSLVISSADRGRGVGSALIRRAEAVARAAGCSRIEATSHRNRTDAHAFYKHLGYAQISRHFLKKLR